MVTANIQSRFTKSKQYLTSLIVLYDEKFSSGIKRKTVNVVSLDISKALTFDLFSHSTLPDSCGDMEWDRNCKNGKNGLSRRAWRAVTNNSKFIQWLVTSGVPPGTLLFNIIINDQHEGTDYFHISQMKPNWGGAVCRLQHGTAFQRDIGKLWSGKVENLMFCGDRCFAKVCAFMQNFGFCNVLFVLRE